MAIVLVIDLPTWLVATAGACALAVLVWQGRAQAARRDCENAPEHGDDEWYVVAEGAPDADDEAAPVVGEVMPKDVAEEAPVIGEGMPEDVAEAAPVAAPAPVAETTPAQYYYTQYGRRVHTMRTCWGLRSAKAIFVSPTHELSGKTRCNICFLD